MIDTLETLLEETQVIPAIMTDPIKSASAVGLVYIFDNQPGITRHRGGNKKFYYLDGNREITDKAQLARIKSLVLPPAWEDVWICKLENGHLQATGYDQLHRKQYRYHPLWIAIRNQTKYYRLSEFGKQLPMIRANLERDLSLRGLPQRKVLAAMVSLLERINIRVGNAFYEKLYGSFGLTTLKNRHVKIEGAKLHLSFIGKKGVRHKITLASKRLANIIRGCKEIPGKALFEYYDEDGNIHPVDSGTLNNYIKEISGGDFTAKDFRTWAGSVQALIGFKEVGGFETMAEMNRKIPAVLDTVARQLGNTRAVCKKYYVHPLIIGLYQERKLEDYMRDMNGETKSKIDGYVDEERILLKILENEHVKNKHLIG
ncbi:MAG TPA: DNA topoisomerase I [Prolixibacteraceae bacterium]|jgi:DNA topoisomerase-1|nr:DNA topoisomerase I [Prolixibacteraceae bacterium]